MNKPCYVKNIDKHTLIQISFVLVLLHFSTARDYDIFQKGSYDICENSLLLGLL